MTRELICNEGLTRLCNHDEEIAIWSQIPDVSKKSCHDAFWWQLVCGPICLDLYESFFLAQNEKRKRKKKNRKWSVI